MASDTDAGQGLSPEELLRYRRHLTLPEVGPAGQAALARGRVLVVGAGGLGSPAALYLAAAGVGTLGLIDHDQVEVTNLPRQILFRQADLGRRKVTAAKEALRGVNPHVKLLAHDAWLSPDNALELLARYDLVVNGSDNFPTRYLVNDACVLARKPCVDASVYRFEGQVTVYDPASGGPCYRCRFPQPPPQDSVPSCAEAGVLGAVTGLMGCLQAAEAIKLLLRRAGLPAGEPLVGRVLLVDAWTMEFRELPVARRRDCPVCGEAPSITRLAAEHLVCPAERPAQGLSREEARGLEMSVGELAARLATGDEVYLLDVRERWEWDLCRLSGAVLVPMSELEARLPELPADRPVVAYCHAGVRSLRAAARLREAGYPDVKSLRGGIDAWSQEIDPTVRRY
ncbi:MAG: molybdopterin-synthase adenylyltransferase MoeB [Armatimonadetes bacterium]|nr:molybdopterin-synthase adenylyltransferase MoeB [Armatimonadota bacterium]